VFPTKGGNNLKKKKKNNAISLILSILAFVLLAGGVFYGTYYFFMGRSSDSYENSVKVIIDKINEVNSSVSALIKGQALDADRTRKELSAKIDILVKQKDKLSSMGSTDKYIKDHDKLILGLDSNILVYRQIDAILRNPSGKDIAQAGEDLKKYRQECIENYSGTHIRNAKIELSDASIKLVDYTLNYVNEMVKLQRDKEINQNQNLTFINSIDSLITKFSSIKIDFAAQMSIVRSEKGNLDNVIALANKNKDELAGVYQEFSNLAVPSNKVSSAISSYQLFKKILQEYDTYLEDFMYAANNEKLSGGNISKEKITEIYSASIAEFNKIAKDYTDFLKVYSEFREASSK
jgi:hypothetical protein